MLEILVTLYALFTIYRVVLSILQINYIQRCKEPVVLPEAEFHNAAIVAIQKQKFEIIHNIFLFITVAIWSVWGASALASSLSGIEMVVVRDALLVALFLVIGAIINLPFDIYSKFVTSCLSHRRNSFKDEYKAGNCLFAGLCQDFRAET